MLQTSAALILFLFPLAYSPGPGNMFFAAIGARFGLRATLAANMGYHLATWLVTFLLGLGFRATQEALPGIFGVLKGLGALYVLWIAWKLFSATALDKGGAARAAGFCDGVVLLLLNPKAYVIIALMFTQFLGPAGAANIWLVALITSIFTLNNLVAFIIWAWAGDMIASVWRAPSRARVMNRVFATILAAVALWMVFL